MNNLFDIVKQAIDTKISLQILSAQYYLNEKIAIEASNMLYNKAVIVKNASSNTKIVKKIESYDDYINLIKNGAVSIYEPIDNKTSSFRIKFENNDLQKSQILNSLLIIRNRLIEAGFACDIIKCDDCYGVKCISSKKYNTEKLYSFASELTNGLGADLSELKIGKTKRFYYSLADNGDKDVIINIGENG